MLPCLLDVNHLLLIIIPIMGPLLLLHLRPACMRHGASGSPLTSFCAFPLHLSSPDFSLPTASKLIAQSSTSPHLVPMSSALWVLRATSMTWWRPHALLPCNKMLTLHIGNMLERSVSHCQSVSYSLSRNSPAFFLLLDCWLSKLKRISREATNLCFPLLFGRDITQQYFHIFSQYLPSLCFSSFPCQETFSVTPQPSERNIRNISKSFS